MIAVNDDPFTAIFRIRIMLERFRYPYNISFFLPKPVESVTDSC